MDPWRALQFRARHLCMDSNMIKSLGVFLIGCICSLASWAMTSLDDSQMEGVTGQALFQMTQTVGNTANANQNGLTFYKLGLDGTIALNANINQLNLGCGGVNGIGGCDISINQMSISGNGCANRALNCDAVMTNPYVELAIANDGTPTNRSLAGFRFSADNMTGLLSFGQNGPNPNGLNTFSGYMTTMPITGTALTQAVNLGGKTDPKQTVLSFATNPSIFLCTSGCYSGNIGTADPTKSAGVNIPSLSVPFSSGGASINGTRVTSTQVTATGAVPTVSLNGGQLFVNMQTTICVAFFICVPSATVNMQGSVSGLTTSINFSENLGYIHDVQVSSPFYLAFEKQAIQWPGAATPDVAQRGWWMSFANPVNLGVLNPTQQIDISPTFGQMAAAFANYFNANPIPISTSQGLQQLFSGAMTVNVGALNIPSTLTMNVSNLALDSHQNVVPNCMGGYKFC